METNRIRVLAVDHSQLLLQGLWELIRQQPDMEAVGVAATADEAVALFAKFRLEVTLIDLDLPSHKGLRAIERIRQIDPDACIVGLLTYEWDEAAVAARRAGAWMCLAKDHLHTDLPNVIRERCAK